MKKIIALMVVLALVQNAQARVRADIPSTEIGGTNCWNLNSCENVLYVNNITWIPLVEEPNLDVNSSVYWDGIDEVSDIQGSQIQNDLGWVNSTSNGTVYDGDGLNIINNNGNLSLNNYLTIDGLNASGDNVNVSALRVSLQGLNARAELDLNAGNPALGLYADNGVDPAYIIKYNASVSPAFFVSALWIYNPAGNIIYTAGLEHWFDKTLRVRGGANITFGDSQVSSLALNGDELDVASYGDMVLNPGGILKLKPSGGSHTLTISDSTPRMILETDSGADIRFNASGKFEVYPNTAGTNPGGTYGLNIQVDPRGFPYMVPISSTSNGGDGLGIDEDLGDNLWIFSRDGGPLRIGGNTSGSSPYIQIDDTGTELYFRIYTDTNGLGAITKYGDSYAGAIKNLLMISNNAGGKTGEIALSPASRVITVGDFDPYLDSTFDLGNETLRFKDLYISGQAKLKPTTSAPSCGAVDEGNLYADDSHALCYCNSTTWINIGGGGSCA